MPLFFRDIEMVRHDPHPSPHILRLADTMQGIVHSVQSLDDELDNYRSWRDSMRTFYADGLTYKEVNDLKISKADFARWFKNLKIGEEINPKKSRISIRWCKRPLISQHFWER